MQSAQDMPPRGGFAPVQYARNMPARGPSGVFLFTAGIATMLYGFYKIAQVNGERRELRREKKWARYNLVPLLQAEADRDIVRRLDGLAEREAELMKDVPGWTAGDLKASVPGLGKDGKLAPGAAEPVYHNPHIFTPVSIVHMDNKGPTSQRAPFNAGLTVLKT